MTDKFETALNKAIEMLEKTRYGRFYEEFKLLKETNEDLKRQLESVLPELQRLQELCRMQEQHGTEHASKLCKEFEEIFQKHFKDLLA